MYSTVRDSYVQSGRPLTALFRLVVRHDRPNLVNVYVRTPYNCVSAQYRTVHYNSVSDYENVRSCDGRLVYGEKLTEVVVNVV